MILKKSIFILAIILHTFSFAQKSATYFRTKSIGYYRDDNKIGDWNYYTKDGFIEKKEYYYNDSTYLETKYYNNNQIKSEGTIEIKITNNFDTILAVNPENGNEQQIFVRIDDIIKKNDWKYYHKDGTVAKKEEIEALDKADETK